MGGKTSYNTKWEVDFCWLQRVKNNKHKAFCKLCRVEFRIDGSGRCQVKSHEQCHGNKKKIEKSTSASNQRFFEIGNSSGTATLSQKTSLVLTPADQVCKAEILQALHYAASNYSFASAKDDGQRFRAMFPDSQIAQNYAQADTKVKYVIQFGLAENFKRGLIYDINKSPYTFKFDETTNRNVHKQFDGYVQYWSKRGNKIVNSYCGSLFLGHCKSDQMVCHYNEFMNDLKLNSNFLLHLGMDGPNVNKCFQEKLSKQLQDDFNTSILNIGTCSLHPVHTGFRKGIKELSFDIDGFFNDLFFFFKHSSARREDYSSLQEITEIVAKYVIKHVDSRWLTMKYVALRVVDQYENLKEYFLTFLPKDKETFNAVKKTERYQRIVQALQDEFTLAYISFCAFATCDFENFLLPFQSEEPKIHILYTEMCKLLKNLMSKFIRKKCLESTALEDLHKLNITKEEKHRPLKFIDMGTKVKLLLSTEDLLHNNPERLEEFQKKILLFYVTSVKYLQDVLPFDINLIRYAQYLHPEKRLDANAISAISNLALRCAKVLENCLPVVFHVKSCTGVEEIVDLIRSQWVLYRGEDIPTNFYVNEHVEEASESTRKQFSYWDYAHSVCEISPIVKKTSKYVRIDQYWSKIGEMTDDNGSCKYPQLFALVKCILSLSHGNAVPERGFSINKILLESHGYTMQNDTIVGLRLVKDEIRRVGGVLNVKISRDLLDDVKNSYMKYEADRQKRKELKDKELASLEALAKEKEATVVAAANEKVSQLQTIEKDIKECELKLKCADDIISEGNDILRSILQSTASNKLGREDIQSANARIDIGLDRKRKLVADMEELKKSKERLTAKKKK